MSRTVSDTALRLEPEQLTDLSEIVIDCDDVDVAFLEITGTAPTSTVQATSSSATNAALDAEVHIRAGFASSYPRN